MSPPHGAAAAVPRAVRAAAAPSPHPNLPRPSSPCPVLCILLDPTRISKSFALVINCVFTCSSPGARPQSGCAATARHRIHQTNLFPNLGTLPLASQACFSLLLCPGRSSSPHQRHSAGNASASLVFLLSSSQICNNRFFFSTAKCHSQTVTMLPPTMPPPLIPRHRSVALLATPSFRP